MTTKPKFEAVIRDWRTKLGLSQSEAAAKLSVPKKTLQKWDQGLTEPGRWRLESILKAMAKADRKAGV